jgi:hypothetical protein
MAVENSQKVCGNVVESMRKILDNNKNYKKIWNLSSTRK